MTEQPPSPPSAPARARPAPGPGLPAPAPPSPAPPAPPAPASRHRERPGGFGRRQRGLFWLAILLAATLFVGGGLYAYGAYRDGQGADGAVRGYLKALARGDAPAALAYGTVPAGSTAFLTSSVLRAQLHIAGMHDITIGTDSTTAAGTRVPFRYTLGFAQGALTVNDAVLVRKVHTRWTLTRVATSVHVQLSGAENRATLAGAAIPAGNVLLFPGAVPVQFDSPLLQLDKASEAVSLGQVVRNDLGVELSAAGRSAVTQQLAVLLSACGHGAPGNPGLAARCPVPSPDFVPGSMSGTLQDNPAQLNVQVDSSADGVINVNGIADFTGSYRQLDFNNVAQPRTGNLSVPFIAVGYAVSPLKVGFTVQPS